MVHSFHTWAIFLVIFGLAAHSFGVEFDEMNFKKLTPEERIAFAVSCLQTREQLIEDFSYDLVLRSHGVAPNRVLPIWSEEHYSMFRSSDKYLFHCQELSSDGKIKRDFTQSWDGKEQRGTSVAGHSGGPSGTIRGSPSNNPQELRYNLLLGYRIKANFTTVPVTLSQWLQLPEKHRNSIEVEFDHSEADPFLLIHVTEGTYLHDRVWLDPSRGYMPVRYEYKSTDEKGAAVNWERLKSHEAKKIGEVWIPMKATLETGTDKEWDEVTFEVKRFILDKPTPDQLNVRFDIGMKIMDAVRMQAYKIQLDGSKKFEDMYNSDTGKIVSATQQVSNETAAKAATQPATTPAGK